MFYLFMRPFPCGLVNGTGHRTVNPASVMQYIQYIYIYIYTVYIYTVYIYIYIYIYMKHPIQNRKTH